MRLPLLLAGAVTAGLVMAACSDSNSDKATPTTANQAASTATTAGQATTASSATAKPSAAATTAATTAASPTAQATKKVSANNATRAELTAALQAAGVPSAANWAREVEEYRPYPTNDPNMAKLRQELAKYNPAAGVVDQIIATLSLP